jgi:hypothetical protein
LPLLDKDDFVSVENFPIPATALADSGAAAIGRSGGAGGERVARPGLTALN